MGVWVVDGYKMKEQKQSSKIIDVSYALEMSVNDVTCICSPKQACLRLVN